jgi:hypothetical protein
LTKEVSRQWRQALLSGHGFSHAFRGVGEGDASFKAALSVTPARFLPAAQAGTGCRGQLLPGRSSWIHSGSGGYRARRAGCCAEGQPGIPASFETRGQRSGGQPSQPEAGAVSRQVPWPALCINQVGRWNAATTAMIIRQTPVAVGATRRRGQPQGSSQLVVGADHTVAPGVCSGFEPFERRHCRAPRRRRRDGHAVAEPEV